MQEHIPPDFHPLNEGPLLSYHITVYDLLHCVHINNPILCTSSLAY